MNKKKLDYMIAWRERKIKNLEERLEIYTELVNMCLAICMAGNDGRISKKKVKEALAYRYEISEDDEYYLIKRREDGKNEQKKNIQG
ncbi:MAG: hypothetical protein E7675_00340 [Ruminococcaceae bacterium]|nr:hypothetical protein [Oscillospiraceae bacterium]